MVIIGILKVYLNKLTTLSFKRESVKEKNMAQEYIKDDIVIYDNKIHTIMNALGVNNYELSYIEHPVHQLELSGVPLTHEILEKNGWEHKDDVYFKDYPQRKLVIYDDKAYIINESCSLFLCKVKFIHQLQHLLFGLGINHKMEV